MRKEGEVRENIIKVLTTWDIGKTSKLFLEGMFYFGLFLSFETMKDKECSFI
jgi:hypothetical protein